MTTSTPSRAFHDPATDAIDLSAAHRIARGTAQRAWLAEVSTADGLCVADHLPRRWSGATYDRMTAFLTKLWAAGYLLSHQPGPRGGRGTWWLCGYQPDQAPHRRIITALGYDVGDTAPSRWQPANLLATLAAEDLETVRNATDLLDLARWVEWYGLLTDTPAQDALARILDACRSPDRSSAADSSRGALIARLLNGSRTAGAILTLEQAALIADALTHPPRCSKI